MIDQHSSQTPPRPGAILRDGLWRQNTGLAALLGLCPLLAVSNNAVNALGLGIATVLVLGLSNAVISALRGVIRPEIRLPLFVMVIATAVTVVQMLMQAWLHGLYTILGLFVPLIITNCAVMARAESFASRQRVWPALLDGLATGAGFALVLLVIGGIRELLGHATLFAGAARMLGPGFAWLEFHPFAQSHGLLLAVLPPGAFFVLALLVAAKNRLDARAAARRGGPRVPTPVVTSAS